MPPATTTRRRVRRVAGTQRGGAPKRPRDYNLNRGNGNGNGNGTGNNDDNDPESIVGLTRQAPLPLSALRLTRLTERALRPGRTHFSATAVAEMVRVCMSKAEHTPQIAALLLRSPTKLRFDTPLQRHTIAEAAVSLFIYAPVGATTILNDMLPPDAKIGLLHLRGMAKGQIALQPVLVELIALWPEDMSFRSRRDNLESLIQLGCDVRGQNSYTLNTPLHVAVMRGFVGVADALCYAGADIEVPNRVGESPLDLAVGSPIMSSFIADFVSRGKMQAPGFFVKVFQDMLPSDDARRKLVSADEGLLHSLIRCTVGWTSATVANVLRHASPEALENKYDPDDTDKEKNTPLNLAAKEMDYLWVMALLDRGASTSAVNRWGHSPLHTFADAAVQEDIEGQVRAPFEDPQFQPALRQLVEHSSSAIVGAVLSQPWMTPQMRSAIEACVSVSMWKGWTTTDAEKFDAVFTPEGAKHFTACPVCLKSANREVGPDGETISCNYMHHDCSKLPGFYHKRLFDLYKDARGEVNWCTICNRIAQNHGHFQLRSAAETTLPPLLVTRDIHADGVCHQDGGGDLPEKVARFRRLREFALRDLQPQVGTITAQEAMEQLVEEMWNAPLARSWASTLVAKNKTWNIPSDEFPAPQAEVVAAAAVVAGPAAPDVKRPAVDAADPALQPLLVVAEGLMNAISMKDIAEGVHFRHRKKDGTVNTHKGELIGKEELTDLVQKYTMGYAGDNFGDCPWSCDARLYPEEVRPFVPAEVYDAYRIKFNERFRGGMRGGGVQEEGLTVSDAGGGGLLRPLEDGQCALPPRAQTPRAVQAAGGRPLTRRRRAGFGHKRTSRAPPRAHPHRTR